MTAEPVGASLSDRNADAGNPTWSVLIATLARRGALLDRVLADLRPGVTAAAGRVEVVAYRNRGERLLGEVRQALVEEARGAYLSFVDDDDRLPEYHVEKILERLVDGWPDYVGFRMQAYLDDRPLKPTYHNLGYGGWSEDAAGYYRDTSHLNPVRTELARRCDFRKTTPPEDVAWSDQLRAVLRELGEERIVHQRYLDDVMYRYYANSGDSAWRPGHEAPDAASGPLPDVDLPHFRWHPGST